MTRSHEIFVQALHLPRGLTWQRLTMYVNYLLETRGYLGGAACLILPYIPTTCSKEILFSVLRKTVSQRWLKVDVLQIAEVYQNISLTTVSLKYAASVIMQSQ